MSLKKNHISLTYKLFNCFNQFKLHFSKRHKASMESERLFSQTGG